MAHSISDVQQLLDQLNPFTDTTAANQALAEWELQALLRDAAEFPDVAFACALYDQAGVHYTPALRRACMVYAGTMRDIRFNANRTSERLRALASSI
jgi:hypothetical protein